MANAWLFVAISVPLTVGTLFIWWVWVRLQAYRGEYLHYTWPLKRLYPFARRRERAAEKDPWDETA